MCAEAARKSLPKTWWAGIGRKPDFFGAGGRVSLTPRFKRARFHTNLDLLPEGIEQLALHRLKLNEDYLLGHAFPMFGEFPADAQLGIHSMAWACGAGFPKFFPRFTAAAKVSDWAGCVRECTINAKNNPGLVPRNWANKKLFAKAGEVAADPEHETHDPEKLYGWP